MTLYRFGILTLWGAIVLSVSLPCMAWAVDWWRKEFKRRRLGGELYEWRDGKIVEKDEPNRYTAGVG
jgi:hypothetical protein